MSKIFKGLVRATTFAGMVFVASQSISVSWASNNNIMTKGGTNGGGSGRSAIFSQWCTDANGTLRTAETRADMALLGSNPSDAKAYLVAGLNNALAQKQDQDNQIDESQSLTFRLLTRGVKIANMLDDASLSGQISLDDQVTILKDYYKFINDISNQLDIPLFIVRSSGTSDEVRGLDQNAFEQRYSQYAQAQLAWLLSHFTSNAFSSDDPSHFITKGSDAGFFKLAELVSSFVIKDLEDSLFADQYACMIGELKSLKDSLRDYNSGDVQSLGGPRVALNNFVVPQLQTAEKRIASPGCRK